MRSIGVEDGHLVLREQAVVVVRNGLLDEVKDLEDLNARVTMLLGRELQALRQLSTEVIALYDELHAAQVAGEARIRLSDSVTVHFRRALHRIRADEAACVAANTLRTSLGAGPTEMLPRTHDVATVAAELPRHVGDAVRPRTLGEWIENETSPRLELVQKTCSQFLETGEWLKLGVEMKGWRRRGLLDDITKEAEAMWRYGRVDGDKFRAHVEAFTLVPEAKPYLDRVLALIRAGTKRFLEGANRDRHQRPAVTEAELMAIAGDLPVDTFMRFVGHVSCLGSHVSAPFSWTPDRDVLRYYPAETYEDLVAVDSIMPRRLGTGEQCLWLLRVVADTWIETHTWPTLDGILADHRVGPQFYYTLKSLNFYWIKALDYGFASVDLDGLIVGASHAEPIVQAVATIVGALADELVAEEKANVERIAKLTGIDSEFVRHLLPLLAREDLGLSIHGDAKNPEAFALSCLAEYIDVRTPEALATKWVRNRERHPEFARADDKDRLNVFGAKTLRDRLLALFARGGDLRRMAESSFHAEPSNAPLVATLPTPARAPAAVVEEPARAPRVNTAFAAQAQRNLDREAAKIGEAASRLAAVEIAVPSLLAIVSDTCRDLDAVVLHASQCGLRIRTSQVRGPSQTLEESLRGLATSASSTVWTCDADTDVVGVLDIRLSAQYRKRENRWPIFLKLWIASHPVRDHGYEIEFSLDGAPSVPGHSLMDPGAALPTALEFVLLVASTSLALSELGHLALQWCNSDSPKHPSVALDHQIATPPSTGVAHAAAPIASPVPPIDPPRQVTPPQPPPPSLRSRLTSGELPVLDDRAAPWNCALPDIETGVPEVLHEVVAGGIDVLLLTAVSVEREAMLRLMKPLPGRSRIAEAPVGHLTYYVGVVGDARVVLTMSRPGAVGRDASIMTLYDAMLTCAPRSVIAVGIAFGGFTKKLRIGDVLVSNRVVSYEPMRKQAAGDRPRGSQFEPRPILLNRFRNVLGWRFVRPDGVQCSHVEGQLLSSEKLVDDLDFKEEQFTHFPESVGGEMEGAGVAAAAERFNVEWIIVKAVCDWGDGTKGDDYHPLAAAAAASLVAHVISPRAALADLPEKVVARAPIRPKVAEPDRPLVVSSPAPSQRNVAHPANTRDRGDRIGCRFYVMNPRYRDQPRWRDLADVWVEVISSDKPLPKWLHQAYLIPGLGVKPELRDAKYFRAGTDPQYLDRKRKVTERFVEQNGGRELVGEWFTMRNSTQISVYCEEYDEFLKHG